MASLKAIAAMLAFSAIVFFIINAVGLNHHQHDVGRALIGSIVLLVALVVNVFLYLKIAGEEPFKWFND